MNKILLFLLIVVVFGNPSLGFANLIISRSPSDFDSQLEEGDLASILLQVNGDEAIVYLRSFLESGNAHARGSAIIAFGQLKVKEAIPDLRKLLQDENQVIQVLSINSLGELQAKEAIPELRDILNDKNKNVYVRDAAANALGQLQAKEVISDLRSLLKDEESDFPISVINALGQLQAKEAIVDLRNIILNEDKDDYIRYTSASALGQLQAKEAISDLRNLLKENGEKFPSVRVALAKLQIKEVIPSLLILLKDRDTDTQIMTITAFPQLGRLNDVTTELIELLKDENSDVRSAAAETLAKLGSHSLIPYLFVAMSKKDNDEKVDNGLRNIESSSHIASGELLDFLLRRLKNGDTKIRQSATISALHMDRGNNLNEVQKRLLRKALSLIDQRTRDAAAEQLADEDEQETEAKARQLPINQPALETKPLTLNELKIKLDGFNQQYADWRERRDAELATDTATDPKATNSEANKLADPAPFIYEYAYAIANMDEAEGIKLLGHNLAKVREAAARGLANSDFLGVPLLQKLEQEWLATDNPITRQGLFHAIDIALLAMEGIGADKELEALKAYEPTLTNERSAASIKPRVEWTRIQLQWRVDALKELKEMADRQLPGLLKEYCLNPDGTDIEGCTIER